ncbi:MAG: CRTAC1 family protein [Acidobacteria bacterium]|nr:CRTAC1 family protein [Acidobacteriota bacterium]
MRPGLPTLVVGLCILAAWSSHGEDGGRASHPVTFVNVSEGAGLAIPHVWGSKDTQRYIIEVKGSGLGFIDFDRDGWLDVYLTNGVRFGESYTPEAAPTSHLLRNNRDGTFSDVTARAGVGRTGWGTGVAVGDYDNDGWDDLFCTYWGHNVLFRNNGDGTFQDVSKKAGLHGERVRWGSGSTFLDHDRDGDLDLFVANFIELDIEKVKTPLDPDPCLWKGLPIVCGPRGLPAGSNLFYRNEGDGTFTDVSQEAGVLAPGPRYSITPVSYDFDNDGWPDVYVAVDSLPSLLFRNNHDGTFTDVAVPAWAAYNEDARPQAGMGLAVGDYNADGWLDIFKTHFQDDTPVLFRAMGDGTFADETGPAGMGELSQYVSWGTAFMDYDNDGWKDLFYVTGHVYQDPRKDDVEALYSPRVVLRNLGNGKFRDVSSELGPGVSERFCSRGSAYGDYDNDGDVDVLVLNVNDPPSLLRNDGGNAGHWILIKLVGTRCNRSAIGARVRVVTDGHAQIDEVHSGGSVMSQSDLRLHFGLGEADVVDRIEVRWPTTQEVETFERVPADQTLTIREGSGIVDRRGPAGVGDPDPSPTGNQETDRAADPSP